LTYVRLDGFKGFQSARLNLGPFTVIVGTNASGKSNLRDALRFLHGVARGYTLAEIFGEKWIEGGVLQWKGIRGGTREATFLGQDEFRLEVGLEIDDGGTARPAVYFIKVHVPSDSTAPWVSEERLLVKGKKERPVFQVNARRRSPTADEWIVTVVKERD
jgi:predicted ATPase